LKRAVMLLMHYSMFALITLLSVLLLRKLNRCRFAKRGRALLHGCVDRVVDRSVE
jgi:hypothetical protein